MRAALDEYSSAILFGGWQQKYEVPRDYEPLLVVAARTWLLRIGWSKAGSLDERARPGRG